MKKTILVGLTAMSSFVFGQKYLDMIERGTFTVDQIEKSAEKYFDEAGRGRGTGYKQFQRWLYMARRSQQDNGVLVPYNKQLKTLRSYKNLHKELEVPGISSTPTWNNLGPTYKNATSGWNPGVGRITSIGVDLNDLNHYIVGGPNSGVWKTTDNGANWTNITDGFQDLNVWSLEIDPNNSNKYWWGSDSGDMFTSDDGGQTWQSVSFPGAGKIERILIHPSNSNIVFASSYYGLYKTTNGGSSWTQVLSHTLGYDIEFKPGDPSVVYYSGTRVYQSTDGGDTFTELNGGFSTSETKMMAVTPDNPNLLLVVEERSGKFGGLYKSINNGASFTKIQTGSANVNNYFGYSKNADDDSGQSPRDMDIIVDPSDENTIIIAGIQCWKSTNGGTSFSLNTYWTPGGAASSGISYNHADVDIMKWHGSKIFTGSDGGIYTSTDKGANYVDKTTGISCREFYRIGVSKTDPNVISGGAQDNGTSVMRGVNREWVDWLGADGMESFVDWSDPNRLYGTSQNGSMYKSTNQGNSRTGVSKPSGAGDGDWVTPFEQDPIDASVIYAAFEEVYKSNNDGSSWTKISDINGDRINELKIAPSDNSYLYAADGSSMFVTKTGGTPWSTISPGGTINYIHVSPRDPERVVAVTNNNVYISNNAGASWTDYTKNLPNVSYYCAVWADNAENGLYVGGLGFVSYIEDGMTDYVDFWDGLPMCAVNELEINYVSNTIFAATYGRGLWESDLYGAVTLDYDVAVSDLTGVPSSLCGSSVNPSVKIQNKGAITITSVKIEVYVDGNLTETINHTTNLNSNDQETVVLSQVNYASEGSQAIKVVVSDPNGQQDEKLSNNEVEESTTVEFGSEHLFYIDERSSSNALAWYIRDDQNQIVKSGTYGSSTLVNTELQEEICLEEGCYDFVISDAFNSGGCATPAWNSSTVYLGDAGSGGAGTGEVVSHNGKEYRAQWWTQGNEPGTSGGNMWLEIGDCNISYDTDVLGFKEVGEAAYFEVEVQDYTSPESKSFCFGDNLIVDFSSDNQLVNHCDDVVFTANITGGIPTTYSWDFGDNASPATASGEGPHTIKYLDAGMKTVSLTVDGVNETKSMYMMVSTDVSKAVTADIALNNLPICEGDQMDFVATLTNEGGSPVYSWLLNDVEVSTSSTYSPSGLANGDEVKLKVTSSDECSVPNNVTTSAYTVSLTANLTPSIAIDLVNGETWPICDGGTINLEATLTNEGSTGTVDWKVNNTSQGSGRTFEFSGDNGDLIKAVLNSSEECLTQNDVVSSEVTAVVDVCTSINEGDVIELNTFPNPVVDILTVEGSGIKEIQVTEINGKLVMREAINEVVSKIDLTSLAPATYLLKVIYDSGKEEVLDLQKK